MNEDTTYLEDFLQSVELLPNDARRDFELMREQDKESIELTKELNGLEQQFLKALQRIVAEGKEETPEWKTQAANQLNEIRIVRQRVKDKVSQKIAVAASMLKDLDRFTRKLDTDLAFFETELRGCGEFEQLSRGVEPGSDVAIKPNPTTNEVILGRVICYHADIGMYDIADIDDSKRSHYHEHQVAKLDLVDSVRKLTKGEEVLAIYPDTTSFYSAIVTQAPRRGAVNNDACVTVQFHGDADETGITPQRSVLLRYVLRAPAGWLR